MMKLAIMQPYVFPYLGYFQMIKAVDKFVLYDDVNYIKKGWINRNRILLNGKDSLLTVPCKDVSQNKLINEIEVDIGSPDFKKIIKTIDHAYKKAPYYGSVFPVLEEILKVPVNKISELAGESIIKIAEYLELRTQFEKSSTVHSETRGLDRADRLIEICHRENAEHYINALGGIELYDKTYFKNAGIELSFIKPDSTIRYKQGKNDFVPWLSIIDILMYNSWEETKELLTKYSLV